MCVREREREKREGERKREREREKESERWAACHSVSLHLIWIERERE